MASSQWCFADFRLDPDNGCLWRGTQPVALTPKAFDVLHYLVTHPDRLVTKDTLLDAVWPETAISDAVVRIAIGELRRALGDTAQASRFIATMHRRGYRFVAPVAKHTEEVPGPVSAAAPAIPQSLLVALPGVAAPSGARVWLCLRCQHPNPDEAQFCTACAAPLMLRCPTCGQDNLPGAVFCQACATALVSTLPSPVAPSQDVPAVPSRARVAHPLGTLAPPEAERRQLTVLFCDLVDSTMLAGRLDPEDYREVVQAYHQTCAAVIHQYDGYIAQYLGDGILVYFGYPRAHEDDAQRAARTGLGMLHALGSLNTRLPLPPGERLAVRLGVHTGLVVVGNMGSGARQEPLALGETPNLAARLQALATPNTLVISAATWQLLGGFFACQALGRRRLHGRAQTLEVYQVLSETTARSRLEAASRTGLTPLVGRELEIRLLRERWAQVKDGLGQVVLLSGEAGIGKSRLVQVLREHVATEPQAWLTLCQCSPYYQHSALYPLIDLLERVILHFERGESSEQKLNKLEGLLVRYRLPLAEAVPFLAALLSFSPSADYAPLTMSPAQQKQQTLHTLLTMLLRIAAQQPALFVIEDLHWADPSTLELLSLLVDQAPTARILVLFTFRPDFRPPWTGRSYLTQMTLSHLTRRQAVEMTGRLVHGKALPAEVVEQVVAKTDGVPLFVEELTKMVLESGWLREQKTHYELTRPLLPLAIPTTIHDSLLARLDHLGTVKGLAQLGATLGHEFSYELLRAVAPWHEETLQQELHQLVEAEFLYQRGLPPQATYLFKHVLIQDAAYQSLLRSTRQQYHRQIAQVLEAQFPETVETQPELLAHHYTEASLNEQAVAHWQRAGQRARSRSANLEAIGHLTKGLEVLKTQPETPERLRQELDLQMALGPAFMAAKGYGAPDVGHTYARARALCQQLGELPQGFQTLWGLHAFHLARGELRVAHALGEQCIALARRAHDPTLLLAAHQTLGVTLYYLGELVAAHAQLEQGITLYDPQQHRALLFHYGGLDLGVQLHSHAALALWLLGYPEQARQQSDEMLRHAQALAHPYSLVFALNQATVLSQLRRDGRAVQEQAEEVIAMCAAQGLSQQGAMATILRGWGLVVQGQGKAGIAQMRHGLTASEAVGTGLGRAPVLAQMANAYGHTGQPEAGLHLLAEARVMMDTTEERWWEAEVHRLRGDLLWRYARAEAPEAETCLLLALAVAQRQQAKSLELRAAMSLARLWQQQGQRTRAYEVLAPVYNWFTEGFDTADLQEAKALLEELA